VLRWLRDRAYGGDAANGPPVRGTCTRTAARRRGLGAPRGGEARWGASSSGSARFGPGATSGGVGAEAGAGGARGARRRGARRSGPKRFTGAVFELEQL
jgi:hypothetical protein